MGSFIWLDYHPTYNLNPPVVVVIVAAAAVVVVVAAAGDVERA